MSNLPIGTVPWFRSANLFGTAVGIVDCVLRLLEQEEISRAKAGELIRDAVVGRLTGQYAPECHKAPWDRLNFWNDDEAPHD